jgi:hypothetical protein
MFMRVDSLTKPGWLVWTGEKSAIRSQPESLNGQPDREMLHISRCPSFRYGNVGAIMNEKALVFASWTRNVVQNDHLVIVCLEIAVK